MFKYRDCVNNESTSLMLGVFNVSRASSVVGCRRMTGMSCLALSFGDAEVTELTWLLIELLHIIALSTLPNTAGGWIVVPLYGMCLPTCRSRSNVLSIHGLLLLKKVRRQVLMLLLCLLLLWLLCLLWKLLVSMLHFHTKILKDSVYGQFSTLKQFLR